MPTLVVLGHGGSTAAYVIAAKGIAPTRAVEAGGELRRGSARTYSVVHAELASGADAESSFRSMRSFLSLFFPVAEVPRGLQSSYEVRLDWGDFSDSSQGGFVLEPDIAGGLADFGLPVYGTAYVD